MHKRSAVFLPLMLVALLWAGPASAQVNVPIEATFSVLAGQDLTVGDPIYLTLAVTHPAGYQVILPSLAGNLEAGEAGEAGTPWGEFTVISQSAATTVGNGDGTETTSLQVDARLFSPGTFSTPTLPVTVTDGAGHLAEVAAAPATVTIASVLTEGDGELRDIKPQAALPLGSPWSWLLAGLLAAVIMGGLLLWLRTRREPALDTRQPHEIALDGLTHLEALDLPRQGRFKEHYTLLSEIMRVYMERTTGVPMMERTTREIAISLQAIPSRPDRPSTDGGPMPHVGVLSSHAPLILDTPNSFMALLEESDLVKFSNYVPATVEVQAHLAQARQIVETTRPNEDEAGSGPNTVPSHAPSPTGRDAGARPGLMEVVV